jgi:hypothetical protein
MTKVSSGKLIFSNPANPDSAFTPEMKSLSEVTAFTAHTTAPKLKSGATAPKVAVYTAPPNVVVTPGNPLIISGSGPVSVQFGTVTIEPGGQILVYTTADISIETLVKQ